MPRSRNIKVFVNGKAVRDTSVETRDPSLKNCNGRAIACTVPRKEKVQPVENNIVVAGETFPAVLLSGKAMKVLGTKLGKSFFRKDLNSGAVTFAENDPNVLEVYKRLKNDMFLNQL